MYASVEGERKGAIAATMVERADRLRHTGSVEENREGLFNRYLPSKAIGRTRRGRVILVEPSWPACCAKNFHVAFLPLAVLPTPRRRHATALEGSHGWLRNCVSMRIRFPNCGSS